LPSSDSKVKRVENHGKQGNRVQKVSGNKVHHRHAIVVDTGR
jgi:hypothetical protein